MIFAPTFFDLMFYEHPHWRSSCGGRPNCATTRINLSPAQAMADKEDTIQREKNKAPSILYRGRGLQISQDENNSYLSLDLPGVRKNDIQVDLLDDGTLRVESQRQSQTHTVTRQFTLDESAIDKSNIQANLVDGVLTIVIPKKEPEEVAVTLDIAITADRFDEDDSSPKTTTVYTVDVPGISAKNAKVTFHKDRLFLQAERRRGEEIVSKTRRCVQVDTKQIDTTKLQAFLADGVLTIVAPERAVPPPIRIPVGTNRCDSEEPNVLVEVDENATGQSDDSEETAVLTETVSAEEAAADEDTKEHGDWEEVDDARKEDN